MADKVEAVKEQRVFSFDVFDETFEKYRPKGYSKTALKKAIRQQLPEVTLTTRYVDRIFSEEECREIVNQWNSGEAEKFCKTVVRKPWFNHDGVNEQTERFENIRNRHEFNTFDHLSEFLVMKLVAAPEGPDGAEWVNYRGTPRPQGKPGSNEWHKIEACANTLFGKPWLTEVDWHIDI